MGLHRRPTHHRPVVLGSATVVVAGLLAGGLSTAWGAENDLAEGRPATGSTPCAPTEKPAQAVNSSVAGGSSDKWCSGSPGAFLTIDLLHTRTIGRFVVQHAGSGGENASLNTRDFTVSVSTDGRRFSEVVRVTGNTAGITRHDVTPVSARWIRLDAITPTSTSDRTVRIYEFEAYQASTPAG